jgi:hypothetical protein
MHELPAQCMQRIRAAKAETGLARMLGGLGKNAYCSVNNQVLIITFVENYKTNAASISRMWIYYRAKENIKIVVHTNS